MISGQADGKELIKVKDATIDLLFEIGCLRFLPRMWERFLGPNVANVAEHTFRVIWLALLIARLEEKKGVVVDIQRVLLMALVHDMAESRTGELDHLARFYTSKNEERAIIDMFGATLLADEVGLLVQEYKIRESVEAKIVKDADLIDVDLEICEQRHHGWFGSMARIDHQSELTRLYTDSAAALRDKIYHADPHEWHRKARALYVNSTNSQNQNKT